MKQLYCLLLAILCSVGAWAVEDDYLPIVREGVKWNYLFF